MNSILSIRNLTKRFAGITALDDISLEVERGSILGLLGPNGAGKTTLLRLINGLLSFDSGIIIIDGEMASLKATRNIGYMPEERGLYDDITVERQIMFFARLKNGKPERIRYVMDEYLEIFNLSGMRKRKIKELSKGNQQKVQIISTIAHEPSLLILDEPFSGFDPINGAILQDLIGRLHDMGTTIILSSHNMHAIEEMCTHIAMINNGRLLLEGRLEELKEKHKGNELHIITSSPLPDDLLYDNVLTENISFIPTPNSLKGLSYSICKRDGITNSVILTQIADKVEIFKFEEVLPSLNDLFIQYATRQ